MATQTSMSIEDIIEAIGNLSVVELAELIEKFKGKFGVTIAAPVGAGPAAGGAEGAGGAGAVPAAEEQTEFTVGLKAGGEKKNLVIEAIRGVTSLGPKGDQDLGAGEPGTRDAG